MKLISILSCLLVLTFVMHVQTLHRQQQLVGAYGDQDVNNLGAQLKEIDAFLKELFPDLEKAQLSRVETQVVQGINYRYRYSLNDKLDTKLTFTVWDRPWLNSRQITQVVRQSKSQDGDDEMEVKVVKPQDENYEEIKSLFQ